MEDVLTVPVAVGVVDGGVGINFGRRHGLEDVAHRDFLHATLRAGGFRFPETVRYERNKTGIDGKSYVDWMRLRIASDECQVNSVNPQDAVSKIKSYLTSSMCLDDHGVVFETV